MPRELAGVRADQPRSYRELEIVAGNVRRRLEISPHDAIQPLTLFEGLDDILIVPSSGSPIPLRHGVVGLTDSEGYTKYDSDRRVIEVLASVQTYDWLEQGRARAGYFVAHELGHCLLHTDQLVRLAQMPTKLQAAFHRGKREHQAYEDTEWQANAFACALLMPAKGLVALECECCRLTVAAVRDHFGVSREAASYRLDNFAKRRAELTRP